MDKTISKITVFFEEPFWVGHYERETAGKYEICKIFFGSEPKDYQVYEYLLKNWNELKFSKPIKVEKVFLKKVNPKRMQREINKQLSNLGNCTKAQQALKIQHEMIKQERKSISRISKEEEKERKYEIRALKKAEKHRGH